MAASGSMKCVKFSLIVLNLLYFVAGIALIVIGSLVTVAFNEYSFYGGRVNLAGVLLIVVGAIVFLIAFLGCCGAFRESYGMIVTYIVLLGIVIILQLAIFLAIYLNRAEIEDQVGDAMLKTIPEYNETRGDKQPWDILQTKMNCCGAFNYTDWEKNAQLSLTSSVPESCCVHPAKKCGAGATKNGGVGVHKEGCINTLRIELQQKSALIIGFGVGLIVFKLIGLLLAVLLANSIRKEYQNI